MPSVKIRGTRKELNERYPLGEFPPDVITALGKQIIHRFAVGNADISGDDFGKIFANAIGGMHFLKPYGVADVQWNGCSWSAKTVKRKDPFKDVDKSGKIRLISGRNSPTYSLGIHNVLEHPEKTGEAVLNIWNERIKEARHDHDNLRVVVLLRCVEMMEFAIYEAELAQYIPRDYKWIINRKKNLEGYDIATKSHVFTWQPHGSQFTIIRSVPASAIGFTLRRPAVISENVIRKAVGYDDTWVTLRQKTCGS